jgi:predicted secreted hydrolase
VNRSSVPFAGLLMALLAVLLAAGAPARAQVTYPNVLPGVELAFPRDEGAHPDFRIEWWYVTGWLDDGGPEPIGFQVTFFRVRPGFAESNPSTFAPKQILFGHAAIAEPAHGKLRHAERSARAGFDLAYAREGGVDVRIDDWTLRRDHDVYRADVSGDGFRMQLDLRATQPALLQGDGGFSRKGPASLAASYYYSLPHLSVGGTVTVDGRERKVKGEAWFDHEWSSDILGGEAAGWDWMGVNLDGGGALMAFRMRNRAGGELWSAATLRTADGSVRTFKPDEVEWAPGRTWRSPRTGATYPVEWRVQVGAQSFDVAPLMDDAELDSRSSTGTIYWEGPVRVKGLGGSPSGRGYLELTGYAGTPIRF